MRLPRRLFMPDIGSTNIEDAEIESRTFSTNTGNVVSEDISSHQPYTLDDWVPRYPELWEWGTWQQALCVNLQTDDWIEEGEVITEGIWRFRILTSTHLQKLADEIELLEQWSMKHRVTLQPPNSMHDHGIEMKMLELDKILQRFTLEIADVIVARLYPEVRDKKLDHHHAFSVTYGKKTQSVAGVPCRRFRGNLQFLFGGKLYWF